MNAKHETTRGIYCGMEVDLAHRNHCALIRYQEREFVVETADLVLRQSLAKTA